MEDLRKAALAHHGDEKFSDYVIVCGAKEYKCLISPHSDFFERTCSKAFNEQSERKIELDDEVPEAIDCMIQYFYKFDYETDIKDFPLRRVKEEIITIDDNSPTDGNTKDESDVIETGQKQPQVAMQLHAWVYAYAEKYEVPGLKALALAKLKKQAVTKDMILARLLVTAETVYKFLDLPQNDRILKDFLVDAWIFYAKADPKIPLTNMLEVVPRFACEICDTYMRGFSDVMWQRCPDCGKRKGTTREPVTPGGDCRNCIAARLPGKGQVVVIQTIAIKQFWI